jgi:translation initiation factor 2 beta subunit (eIF-2beta)/eIF-5
MSHIHSIQTDAAAQYQEHLERMRAARMAEKKESTEKKRRVQTFESYIDADQDSGQNSHEDPGQEEENESENKGYSAKA